MAVVKVRTEAAFQAQVVELAGMLGWEVYHTYDSRRSNPGFPDLTLVRSGILIFAELKMEPGSMSSAQLRWFALLFEVSLNVRENTQAEPDVTLPVRAFVWTPDDWDEIEQVLARAQ